MDIAKIIRTLGYIVYSILWSPVILLALVVTLPMYIVISIRAEKGIKAGLKIWFNTLAVGIEHDMNFIETGEW